MSHRFGRRRTQVGIAAGLLALVATACTPGSSSDNAAPPAPPASSGFDTSEDVEITVSDGWGTTGTGELFQQVIDDFEAEYPNVTITRDTTDYDSYSQSINLKGSSADPPDVMMLQTAGYGQGFYQFARAGLLLPLDDYADVYGWSDRFGDESNLDVFRFDTEDGNQWGSGPLYGVPEQRSIMMVFYNAELLDQIGLSEPPTNISDFEASLEAARAAGITPIAQNNQYIHTYMALWNALAGDSAEVNDWIYGRGGSFDSDASLEAAATLAEWQDKGYFQEGVSGTIYPDAAALFQEGKSLYHLAGSWMAGGVQDSLGENAGAFQLVGDDADAAPAGGGLTTPLTISSKTEHPDVAAAFLDFFTNEANSDLLYEGGWGMPGASVSADLAQGDDLTSQILAVLEPLQAEGGAGVTPFIDWAAPTLTEQLPAALQKLGAGDLSPEDFVAQIQGVSDDFASERSE